MAFTSLLARSRLSRVGIAGRDAIIAAMTVLLISLSTGYLVHRSATQALENEVKSNLMSLANTAALLTDGDALLQIDTPDDKGTATYERVTAPYLALLGANPNIASIYTVRQVGVKTVFITDSAIIPPGATDDAADDPPARAGAREC